MLQRKSWTTGRLGEYIDQIRRIMAISIRGASLVRMISKITANQVLRLNIMKKCQEHTEIRGSILNS